MSFALAGSALGGLGLFLLAVTLISDGLRLAAGDALRDILTWSTATRLRGFGSGILVTAVVQSSSAVTVATIGFVNAGLLTMVQALGVVYGANIGTTMTGWLVAAVGFQIKVELFALPMIGVGMLMRLMGSSTRLGGLGEALAGFGLFFIGVDVLREAFEVFAGQLDVASIAPEGLAGMATYLGIGVLMTLVTQSSIAAIAITLTAATGGVIGIEGAAAMVVGANVGTTSTAVLAALGATANARRVAAAHVVFNVLTACVALMLLPALLWLVHNTSGVLGLESVPAVTLALFHTVFNLLGVLLMWPLTNRLALALNRRFRTIAEDLGRPAHLDRNVQSTPALAVDALALELRRMAALGREHALIAISAEPGKAARAAALHTATNQLTDAVEAYVARLGGERVPAGLAARVPVALNVNAWIDEASDLAQDLAGRRAVLKTLSEGPVGADMLAFQSSAADLISSSDPDADGYDPAAARQAFADLLEHWGKVKGVLLEAASQQQINISRLNNGLDGLRTQLRLAERCSLVAQRLSEFAEQPQDTPEPEATAA